MRRYTVTQTLHIMCVHSFAELRASTHTCTRWPPSWQEHLAPHSPRRRARQSKCQSWEQSHQTAQAWEQRWTPRQTGMQALGRSGLEGSCPPPAGKCTQPLTWWWACPARRTPGLLWRVGKREKLECCRTGICWSIWLASTGSDTLRKVTQWLSRT